MTSFRFNFSGDINNTEEDQQHKEINWFESEEILPNSDQIKNLDGTVTHAKIYSYGDIEIGHVLFAEVLETINDSAIKNVIASAEKEHSDLVAGLYEGGLKIWECTNDLLEYLVDNQKDINFQNATVLDLGCGAGILGIYTYLKGSTVTFQDYNKEIIEYITIPNVLLNIEEEERENNIQKCKFFSGDWASFNEKFEKSQKYDVILSSETIYNPANYEKLLNIFINRLNPSGTVYLAAKTHYFGVGGGTRQFEAEIRKTGKLKCEVIWKNTDGIQREIMKINFIT